MSDETIDSVLQLSSDAFDSWASARPETELVEWAESFRNVAAQHYGSDAERARSIAERLVRFAQIVGLPSVEGWARRAEAEALLFSGRFVESDEAYEKAQRAWRVAGLEQLEGQLLVGRVHVLSLLGRHNLAERNSERARELLTKNNDRIYLAKLAMNLATLHFQQDQHLAALNECDRASALFAELGLRDATVLGLEINRANALTHVGRQTEALALFDKLEQECMDAELPLLLAQVQMNAAFLRLRRGEFDRALPRLLRAIEYFRGTGHTAFTGNTLLDLSRAYRHFNLHSEARAFASEAVELFQSSSMDYYTGLALYQLALSEFASGDSTGALESIERSTEVFRAEENTLRLALQSLLRGEVFLANDRVKEAESEAIKARGELRLPHLAGWAALAADLHARALLRRKAAEEAVRTVQSALVDLDNTLYPFPYLRLLVVSGTANEMAGRRDAAIEAFENAASLAEDLRLRIPSALTQVGFGQGQGRTFDRLIHFELEEPSPSNERLFDLVERSRTEQLWDRLREEGNEGVDSSPSVPRRRSRELRRCRTRLSWLHTRTAELALDPPADKSELGELRRQIAEQEQLWAELRRQAEFQYSRERPQDDAKREGSIPRLTEPWGAIEYYTSETSAFALVLRGNRIRRVSLDPNLCETVEQLCEELEFEWDAVALDVASRAPGLDPSPEQTLSDRHALARPTTKLLSRLHDLVWKPLGIDPSHRHWVVSPHGPLHRIPFAALETGRGPLCSSICTSLAPSLRSLRTAPAALSEPALSIDTPRSGSETSARRATAWVAGLTDATLPAVESELELVSAHLGMMDTVIDTRPTRSAFLKACGTRDLLHIATHGHLRPDNPMFSQLQLADGPLFIHDLEEAELPGSTVVLTACSSGGGGRLHGDEWIGLARAFLRAGARSVIASLWPIEDAATIEFVDALYRDWDLSSSPPEQLQKATEQLRRTHVHPWSWASFSHFGATVDPTRS